MEHGALYYAFLRWTKWSKRDGFLYKYLESKVPDYVLPPLLHQEDGASVENDTDWLNKRKHEIISLLRQHEYGFSPEYSGNLKYKLLEEDSEALGGQAVRKQIGIYLHPEIEESLMNLLIYLPKNMQSPAPFFVGLNFYGNQSTNPDPAIFMPKTWMRNKTEYGITNHSATEASRGVRSYRWPYEYLISQGFGLATVYYGDICPDRDDGLQMGVNALYEEQRSEEYPKSDWGAISAWAWGLSRAMDYFELDEDIDESNIAVMGHSRLGKTSLWAGAQDERFAYIIASGSGCGGAALSKRCFGETVKLINVRFPHWFCKKFHEYNENEASLPVDQHMLIAANAPRPVYISMADRDLWADPKGMYLALVEADKVYKLFDQGGLPKHHKLQVDKEFHGTLGFHLRPGGHDVLKEDWEQYVTFVKTHMLDK